MHIQEPAMQPTKRKNHGFPDCIALSIEFNQHTRANESAAQWAEREGNRFDWVSPEEHQRAIEKDSVWVCRWYPVTTVEFYALGASSYDALMNAVLRSPVP
jgi:hypothetical protein